MIQTFKEAAFLSNFFWLKMETRIAIKLVSIYIKAIVLLQYSSAFPCSLTRPDILLLIYISYVCYEHLIFPCLP